MTCGKMRILPGNRPSIMARMPSTAASMPPTAPTERAGESWCWTVFSITSPWSGSAEPEVPVYWAPCR